LSCQLRPAFGLLVEQGTVQPVIDGTVPLSDAPEAIRYVKAGHARGKVVIAI